jgi:hypothetical protein
MKKYTYIDRERSSGTMMDNLIEDKHILLPVLIYVMSCCFVAATNMTKNPMSPAMMKTKIRCRKNNKRKLRRSQEIKFSDISFSTIF